MKTFLVAATLLASTPAFAESTIELVPTCVVIDEADELPEAERPIARALLVRALERLDQLIVETGCQDTITLSHLHDGQNVHVRLANSIARRKLTVSVREDMLDVYSRMAKSLLEPPAPPTPPAVPTIEEPVVEAPIMMTTPPQLTDTPAHDESEVAERQRLFYARVGVAVLAGQSAGTFATGWRRGSRETVFDFGFSFVSGGEGAGSVSNASARFQALRYVQPAKRSSTYIGGGASLGYSSVRTMDEEGSDGGVQLDGTLGYEWNRTGKQRFTVEASLMLPLYTITDDIYPAALLMSIGLGI